MRLDKYLKVSRIIKRRTVANEAASAGRITVNERVAKPSTNVEAGDEISIRFGAKRMVFRVENTNEYAKKEDSASMYTILSEDRIEL